MTDLAVAGLRKRRGGTDVLRGLDLAVAGGRLLALLGPSGCGKTTLLRLLAGFDRPDAGSIVLGGVTVDGPGGHVPPERRGIGYVPQEGLLFPHLDVAGNVGFGLGRAERRGGRIAEMLRLVGLADVDAIARRRPHQLSGGQQQRVALARALAPRPGLVLLDEPFNGLDGALRRSVAVETAAVLRHAGSTAVLVTHDPQEAFAVADRLAVIDAGRVAQEGEPADLYARPATLQVARLTGPTVELRGTVMDGAADTALGRIPIIRSPAAFQGPATVVLRPEQVRAASPGAGSGWKVHSRTFQGDHARVVARTEDATLDLRLAGPDAGGDRVWLTVKGEGSAFQGHREGEVSRSPCIGVPRPV